MSDAKGLTGRALGEAVLDHVLSFPEQHDQTDEMNNCGSAGCIVGWTIALHYGFETEGMWHTWRAHPDNKYPQAEGWYRSAADLLGVDPDDLAYTVYREMDEDTAISNFKHLLDTSEL